MENVDIQPKESKLKTVLKRIFIGLLYVVWFYFWRIYFLRLFYYNLGVDFHIHTNQRLIPILSTVVYVLLIIFVYLIISWYRKRNKKLIKWIIINWVILLAILWWWLTKAWVIPNWLDIELLSSEETYSKMMSGWCHENPDYDPNNPWESQVVCWDFFIQ